MRQKRILTIQDYSCLGRCSTTVALPTISCAGIECVALPTALLSNHTDYPSWTFFDLTDQIKPITEKWKEFDHHFDAIYTGYLSTKQVGEVIALCKDYKEKDTLLFVDPAMADWGKLYAGFGPEHVLEMRKLVALADLTKPNLTEACLLTGTPYPNEGKAPFSFYEEVAKKVHGLGAKVVILSGLSSKEGKLGCLVYDGKEFSFFEGDREPGSYHGTGDLFSSALISAIVLGKTLLRSIEIAHRYIVTSIHETLAHHQGGKIYGPMFEYALPEFISLLREE